MNFTGGLRYFGEGLLLLGLPCLVIHGNYSLLNKEKVVSKNVDPYTFIIVARALFFLSRVWLLLPYLMVNLRAFNKLLNYPVENFIQFMASMGPNTLDQIKLKWIICFIKTWCKYINFHYLIIYRPGLSGPVLQTAL